MNQILATVVRREGVPSELRLPSPNIVATATFRVSLYDFLSYSPPISWTIALILSASTAWLFPSTSTAWRYLRGLTPIAIPSATLWHPVTREHAPHRVNQMHCPISSALKLESAPEISRLHLTCAAGVPPPRVLSSSSSCSSRRTTQPQSIERDVARVILDLTGGRLSPTVH